MTKTSSSTPNAFARLLHQYRSAAFPRLSIRALARKMEVSSSYLAALEAGTARNPTAAFVAKIAAALELDAASLEHLYASVSMENALVAPGVDVSPENFYARLREPDVREVWTFAERPQETDERWNREAATLIRECKIRYVYFLPSSDLWNLVLKPLFLESLGERLLRESITAIEINDTLLRPFVFHPPGALLVGQQGVLSGVWGKVTKRNQRIEQLYEMDSPSAVRLHQKLDPLKHELERKESVELGKSISLQRIHPLQNKQ